MFDTVNIQVVLFREYTSLNNTCPLSCSSATFVIASPDSLFDVLFELSGKDNSNKCSNIGSSEEITQVGSNANDLTHLIWRSG